MSTSKKNSMILWIVIVILFSVIFILITGMLNGSFYFEYNDELIGAIGTFAGALVGATLAGGFTLYSVQKQIRNGETNTRINELNSHLRVSTDYIAKVYLIVNRGNLIKSEIDDDIANAEGTYFRPKTMSAINNYIQELNDSALELSTLNYYSVPYDYYKVYVDSIKVIEILKEITPTLKGELRTTSIHRIDNAEYYKLFLENHDRLIFSLSVILDLKKNEEMELIRLREEKINSLIK
ncbi:hypothetical protein BHE17_08735 [Planococcus maritimus]|uniref:hypothetical protein n=1 Tax=Planococcus maritimus TaxID=192421 RepID=UPI00084BC3B7|nr:hypothetical protein [Planococcus maritimus]OED32522.1 hypothetical protein BHE17_08735 [Planococcus maritimus]